LNAFSSLRNDKTAWRFGFQINFLLSKCCIW